MVETNPTQFDPAPQPTSDSEPQSESQSFPPNEPAPEAFPPQQNAQLPRSSRPEPEELIVEWEAASRPFKKRNRQFYTTIAIITFLVSLILGFAGQFLFVAVVIALAFLAYVLYSVPPEIVLNRITNYGIHTDNNFYHWDEMGRYWFTELFSQKLLHIEIARFPNQLTLVLGDIDPDAMDELLSEVLVHEKPLPTSFDKAAQWLQQKIPLDTEA
jgi:hypothetical protein